MKEKTCVKCGDKFTFNEKNIINKSRKCLKCISLQNLMIIKKEDLKLKKEFIKSKSERLRSLQRIFNNYIRLRDVNENCISCGSKTSAKWHASHFYPTTKSFLRFNEDNVHKSCTKCNVFLSGNLTDYRNKLIDKIGLDRVLFLDKNSVKKLSLSIKDINQMKEYYQNKIKQLKSINNNN